MSIESAPPSEEPQRRPAVAPILIPLDDEARAMLRSGDEAQIRAVAEAAAERMLELVRGRKSER